VKKLHRFVTTIVRTTVQSEGTSFRRIILHNQTSQSLSQHPEAETTKRRERQTSTKGRIARDTRREVDCVGKGTVPMKRRSSKFIPLHPLLRLCAVGNPMVCRCDYPWLLPLIVPSDNTEPSTVPDRAPEVLRPNENVEPSATADTKKSNWKSTASATAKLLLRGVRDSADAFGPLKSVASGLCFILENYEVQPSFQIYYPRRLQVVQQTKANSQAIEALAPRVKALTKLLCAPVSEGDIREELRRKILEQ
jgi:hypothetical protein